MAILSTSGVLRIRSGDAAGHQAHEVEGVSFGLQPPCQAGPGLEAAKPALKPVGGGGYLGVPLAAHQIVPAFREVSQQVPSGCRRTRPCITVSQSASRTGPASGGRSRSRWVRSSLSIPRMCRPTVHGCRSRPEARRAGPLAGGHVGRQGRGASPALSVGHLGVTLAAARSARADRAKMSQKKICLRFAGSLCS